MTPIPTTRSGIPRPFTPPLATSSLVQQSIDSPHFDLIDKTLSQYDNISQQMIYAVKYICVKYSLTFIDYINSGYFGSIFLVTQNSYIFALKIALPMDGWAHTPVEPILTMLSSLPPTCITGRPLCYWASHESVDFPRHLDSTASSAQLSDIESAINHDGCHAESIPLFISSTLLSYVPGLDLGSFTELALKHQYAKLLKAQRIAGTQNDYLFKNYKDIKFFSTRSVQLITAQLLLVTFCCHQKGIVHRDIKPSNVLVVPQRYNDVGGGSAGMDLNSAHSTSLKTNSTSFLDIPNPLTTPNPHQHIIHQIGQQIHSSFLNDHDMSRDGEFPRLFPMAQLLDFGLGSLPITRDILTTFPTQEPTIFNAILDFQTDNKDCGDGDVGEGQKLPFELLDQHQQNDANVKSLDLFAIALTSLELLIGYIPGSKTTSKMIQNGLFDGLSSQYNGASTPTHSSEPIIPLVSQQPVPTKSRDIYKFIRKGKMDAILIEFDHYHSELIASTQPPQSTLSLSPETNELDTTNSTGGLFYKRQFSPEMIETFTLLLSPCPIDRTKAIFSPWIQEVLPLIINQLKSPVVNDCLSSFTLAPPPHPQQEITLNQNLDQNRAPNRAIHHYQAPNPDQSPPSQQLLFHPPSQLTQKINLNNQSIDYSTLYQPQSCGQNGQCDQNQKDKIGQNGQNQHDQTNSQSAPFFDSGSDVTSTKDDQCPIITTLSNGNTTIYTSINNTVKGDSDDHQSLRNSAPLTTLTTGLSDPLEPYFDLDYSRLVLPKSVVAMESIIKADEEIFHLKNHQNGSDAELVDVQELINQLVNPKPFPSHVVNESIIGSLQNTIYTIELFQYAAKQRENTETSQTDRNGQNGHSSLNTNNPVKVTSHTDPIIPSPLLASTSMQSHQNQVSTTIEMFNFDHDCHKIDHFDTNPSISSIPDPILPSKHLQFTIYNPFYLASIPPPLFSPTQPQTVLSFTPRPLHCAACSFQSLDGLFPPMKQHHSEKSLTATYNHLGPGPLDSIIGDFPSGSISCQTKHLSLGCTNPYGSVTCDHNPDEIDAELFYNETQSQHEESLAKKVMAFLLGTFGPTPKSNDLPHRYELPQ